MSSSQTAASAAQTARLMYGAMLTGVLAFGAIGPIMLKPSANPTESRLVIVRLLLGLSLAACVAALVLRQRVRRRNTDESADLFWTTAGAPALLTWAPLEAAVLLAIIAYTLTHSLAAVAVGAVALLLFLVFNPVYLERR